MLMQVSRSFAGNLTIVTQRKWKYYKESKILFLNNCRAEIEILLNGFCNQMISSRTNIWDMVKDDNDDDGHNTPPSYTPVVYCCVREYTSQCWGLPHTKVEVPMAREAPCLSWRGSYHSVLCWCLCTVWYWRLYNRELMVNCYC